MDRDYHRHDEYLKYPDVELPGGLHQRYAVVTDGITARFKPKFDHMQDEPGHRASDEQWLSPLPVDLVKGQSLVTDGQRAWVKEVRGEDDEDLRQNEKQTDEPEEICIPPVISFISGLPVDPYSIGDSVHFSASATGSEPITYSWVIGGTVRSTAAEWDYTVLEADVVYPVDPEENGALTVTLTETNDCGEDTEIAIFQVFPPP